MSTIRRFLVRVFGHDYGLGDILNDSPTDVTSKIQAAENAMRLARAAQRDAEERVRQLRLEADVLKRYSDDRGSARN